MKDEKRPDVPYLGTVTIESIYLPQNAEPSNDTHRDKSHCGIGAVARVSALLHFSHESHCHQSIWQS